MYLYEACDACIYVNKYNNKSNLTAGALQLGTNLQEELSFHYTLENVAKNARYLKLFHILH